MFSDSILRSGLASKIAYLHPGHRALEQYKSKYGLENHVTIFGSKTAAKVDVWDAGPKSTIVAFRGTTSIKNATQVIKADLGEFRFRQFHGRIHTGAMTVFENLLDDIDHHLTGRKNILFTGHSLGGAIAVVAAVYIASMLPTCNVACHTFGAPRVGDADFRDWSKQVVTEAVHVCNTNDMVCRFPLCGREYAANHGQHLWISGHGNFVTDHNMDRYLFDMLNEMQTQRLVM